MMNNLAFPLMMGLALGKRKNLTKQESAKAAMMSYASSAVGGNAGAMLGTMTAINAEALQNKTEALEAQLNQVNSQNAQADQDRKVLVQGMYEGKDDKNNNVYIINKSKEVDEVFRRLKTSSTPDSDTTQATQMALKAINKTQKAMLTTINTIQKEFSDSQKENNNNQKLIADTLKDIVKNNNP